MLALLLAAMLLAAPLRADPLARAFDLAAQGQWAAAAEAVAPLGPVAADIVEWQRLRAGDGTLTDYERFLSRRGDWPGLAALRDKGEAAVARSTTPARVIRWFEGRDPATADGAAALARALRAEGQGDKAAVLLARVWTGLRLDEAGQAQMLDLAGDALGRAQHIARLDHLLWEDRRAEARRMLPLVGADWQALAEARLALREDRDGVNALIARVPQALAQDAGLAHARFDWRARKGRTEDALALLRERSASAAALGRPEAWAGRRAGLARAALRDGKPKLAREIAAAHHLDQGGQAADLEFVAGFAALRAGDAAAALAHFERLGAMVATPISVSRADFWQARALQALGRGAEAQAALARAARHQTAYYGLLAAEALGQPLDPALATPPALPDWRKGGFLNSSVTEAALLLYRAGDRALARRFLLHLAETQDAGGLAAMGAFALDKGDAHLAVLIGKQAAARGIILPAVYFPDPGGLMPEGLAVDRPLALAIARRESEFLPEAVSPAGALGLMQVMPGTAKLMAGKLGLAHRPAALTTDPAFNARLGAAYLAHLAEEFGPSLALKAAGYNAGPGRPRAWMAEIGDPRRASVDVVDWVELVPFTETRTYIMRVAEGVAIYRARQAPRQPVAISALLRGTAR
jgi:soluble lytic murein transglycosylase